jgi:hypothetical protein
MITDRKMHEDKARSWIIETPLQYMTKKKKKKKNKKLEIKPRFSPSKVK